MLLAEIDPFKFPSFIISTLPLLAHEDSCPPAACVLCPVVPFAVEGAHIGGPIGGAGLFFDSWDLKFEAASQTLLLVKVEEPDSAEDCDAE